MLNQAQIANKNVIIRADLDLPVESGKVSNTYRLEAIKDTLLFCQKHAGKTLIIGHLGRPNGSDPLFSLKPIHSELERLLNQSICFYSSGYSPGEWWKGGSPLSMLDNLRFDPREETGDLQFARDLCTGADIYVYEAFANYRPCTSLQKIPELLSTVTGFQFDREVFTLSQITNQPQKPTLLILSGAKPDKLSILPRLEHIFDQIIIGGKLASPTSLSSDRLDLNQTAISVITSAISQAGTTVINGPLGYYEDGIHSVATKSAFEAAKTASGFSLLGGGDTLAAIKALGFDYSDFDFVSTGGGAMLEFLATNTHPLLPILSTNKKI